MKWIVEKARYLSYIPIIGMLVGVLAAIYVGCEKTVTVVQVAVLHYESNNPTLYVLFEALDSFLVAVALVSFALTAFNFVADRHKEVEDASDDSETGETRAEDLKKG